jgi:hypothetical protein
MRCEASGGTTSASSVFSRSERVDPAIMRLGAICPGVKPVATTASGGTTSASSAFSRSERVDPAIRPGVKPVATFAAELLRYLTWRGALPANCRNFRNGLHKIANSPVNTPYPLMRHAL